MPRTVRAAQPETCYHVVQRGNDRARVFYDDADYRTFTALLVRAGRRVPLRLLAYCLMPNHVHLVVWTRRADDLARWMHWLLTTHVRRHHRAHDTSGRVWQGRFKAFPIQQDSHLLAVLRYVERNPVRAGLADRSAAWRWSSAPQRTAARLPRWLARPPIELPVAWTEFVDVPQTAAELDALRECARRQRPWGDGPWTQEIAFRLGLLSTLRAPGRPRRARPGKNASRALGQDVNICPTHRKTAARR